MQMLPSAPEALPHAIHAFHRALARLQALDELALSPPAKPVLPGAPKDCANVPCMPCGELSARLQALDELALSLPAKQVLPGALEFAARSISAPEPHARLAACTVVVCIAEGCAEAVRRHMSDVLRVRGSCV